MAGLYPQPRPELGLFGARERGVRTHPGAVGAIRDRFAVEVG